MDEVYVLQAKAQVGVMPRVFAVAATWQRASEAMSKYSEAAQDIMEVKEHVVLQ